VRASTHQLGRSLVEQKRIYIKVNAPEFKGWKFSFILDLVDFKELDNKVVQIGVQILADSRGRALLLRHRINSRA